MFLLIDEPNEVTQPRFEEFLPAEGFQRPRSVPPVGPVRDVRATPPPGPRRGMKRIRGHVCRLLTFLVESRFSSGALAVCPVREAPGCETVNPNRHRARRTLGDLLCPVSSCLKE